MRKDITNNEKQNVFLRSLLEGKIEVSEKECVLRCKKLGLGWLKPPFLVVEIAPIYNTIGIEEKDEYLELIESFVEKKINECKLKNVCFTNAYNNVQALIIYDSKKDIEQAMHIIHKGINNYYSLESFIGIGSCVDTYGQISLSANDAHMMLSYKYHYSDEGVANIANIVQFQHYQNAGSSIEVDRVIGCFLDGDLGRMGKRLNELVDSLKNWSGASETSIKRTLIELTVRLINVASYSMVDVDEVLKSRDPYHWILTQNNTETITSWIMKLATVFLDEMHSGVDHKDKKRIQEIMLYIDNNLVRADLSLQDISESCSLTRTYCSTLFKAETGVGISEYITDKRIELAKKLLTETKLKSKEIARNVGFGSESYFSRVFIKRTGYSPINYRNTFKET